MGFQRSIVVSSKVDADRRSCIIDSAVQRWPCISLEPATRAYKHRALFAPPELTDYLYDDDDEYEAAVTFAYKLSEDLPEFSAQHQGISFAHIGADCFGGTCLYTGFVACDGKTILKVQADKTGHRKLLRAVGIWIWYHYAPFTRGYFDDVACRTA